MLTTFPILSANQFDIKPIKFDYINQNRSFYDDTFTSGGEPYFLFQNELSSILDFDISFDSIHFLTDVRDKFSTNRTQSTLNVYSENIPIVRCSELKNSCNNYWVTLPIEGFETTDSVCNAFTNILPLKNNFSEDHQTLCTPCYKKYVGFNFGEYGLDNYKPELLYYTYTQTEFFHKELNEFTFRIPDWAEPLSGDDISGFKCFGSIANTCPIYSDNIIWDNNGTETTTWFKGDSCSGVWVERYYTTDNVFVDTEFSNLQLLSGVDYTYTRPRTINLNTTNNDEESVVFILEGVDGSTVKDASQNEIDGIFNL